MEFMDPTSAPRRQYWVDTAQELKANPMKWGRAKLGAAGVVTAIREGKYVAFLTKELAVARPINFAAREAYMTENWELIAQRVPENRQLFYPFIRWIGPAEQSRDAGELTDEEPIA